MTKKALVLTGGSVRGAYQAGAVKRLFENGYQPEIVRGISAGALNATYITNQIGMFRNLVPKWNRNISRKAYVETGKFLVKLWEQKVTSCDSIIEKQYFKAIIKALFNKFPGLVNNKPLKRLINSVINKAYLKDSCLDFAVGAVNIKTGEMEYVDQFNEDIMDYVIASTAIPFVMPVSNIKGKSYYDGGIRDSAPLKSAIKAGADEIVVVSCSPVNLSYKDIDTGNVLEVADRLMGVIMNETLQNDLAAIERINKEIREGTCKDKSMREIRIKIIAPEESIPVKLTKFNKKDISNMIDMGYKAAAKYKWRK